MTKKKIQMPTRKRVRDGKIFVRYMTARNPQKRSVIVKTKIHDISAYDEHPSGQNMIVAVMCYDGYNMEDGVILNQASVQRGLARSTYFRPVGAEELRYSGGLEDEVCIPDKDVKGYRSEKEYRCLEEDGIIYPEAAINEGDVVIGRTSPPRFLSSLEEYNLSASVRRESSTSLKHGERGTADFVVITENDEGNKLIQVRLREERIPEIGDKFTSRHGQKGVTGILVPQQDIPFSESGIIPDVIFTPHGVSSRMTISHLIELIGAKVGALAGRNPGALARALELLRTDGGAAKRPVEFQQRAAE